MRQRHLSGAIVLTSLVALAAPASAHFKLLAPACYSEQDSLGLPLKSAPCGQADPGNPVVLTGEVTTLAQGQMLTITIDEAIFHPGHYRIAIAPDMASLPDDPPVTPGSTPCGTTEIDPSPTLPLLADGVLVHAAPFSGPQTVQIPLPADFTCDHCIVQVVEFMANHPLNNPGGCFYHHCGDVVVVPTGTDAGLATDAGAGQPDAGSNASDAGASRDAATAFDAGVDASTTPTATSGGCGCRVSAATTGAAPLPLLALCLLALRRRPGRRSR